MGCSYKLEEDDFRSTVRPLVDILGHYRGYSWYLSLHRKSRKPDSDNFDSGCSLAGDVGRSGWDFLKQILLMYTEIKTLHINC